MKTKLSKKMSKTQRNTRTSEKAPEVPSHLTGNDVCLLADLTPGRISQLKKQGVLKTDYTGEFPFIKTAKALIMYYKAKNTGSENNRLLSAKADVAEMKVKEMKKLLIRREAVEYGLSKMTTIIVEQLNEMPEALAPLIANKDADTNAETIREYVAKILNNMRTSIENEFGGNQPAKTS